MITTLANIETDAVNDWLDFYRKIASEFQIDIMGAVPTTVVAPRYRLPNYNVHRDTIVSSDGTPVLTYRPLENDMIVSDVVMGASIAAGSTFSYTANTVAFRTRESPNPLLQTPLESPRFFILHSQNLPMRGHRQVNDEGKRIIPRKLFMNFLIDTDDGVSKALGTTGPLLKNKLAGLAEQAIQRPDNLLWLFQHGYEDIRIQPISFFPPEQEKRIGVYRAMLMVAMNVYALPF
jgi:hypothetical protein